MECIGFHALTTCRTGAAFTELVGHELRDNPKKLVTSVDRAIETLSNDGYIPRRVRMAVLAALAMLEVFDNHDQADLVKQFSEQEEREREERERERERGGGTRARRVTFIANSAIVQSSC